MYLKYLSHTPQAPDFSRGVVDDKVTDDSIVSVKLERSYPDCNKVGEIIYRGAFKKIKRGIKF